MRITIIVINWNQKELTARCLESLGQSSTQATTILVDNGSQDGSAAYLPARFPHTELIALASNLGFGRACNIAIQRALQDPGCEAVFLVNNDAMLQARALDHLERAASAHPEAGILGPKIYYHNTADTLWYAGSRRRRGVLAARVIGRGRVDGRRYDRISEVDYVFGAAMFIRRLVFERIGMFDERFFLYLEDLDLCLRAQKAGFKLLFVPQARLWHVGSASTAHNLALRRYHHVRSTLRFLQKHLSPWALLPASVFWTAVFLRMICQDLLDDNARLLHCYGAALRDAFSDGQPPNDNSLDDEALASPTSPASSTRTG
jgi:hypothetical protein